MLRRYPTAFRRKVLDLVVAERARREGHCAARRVGQTIYSWCNQDPVDRGLRPSVTTAESVESTSVRRRIRELECETGGHQAGQRVVESPSGPRRSFGNNAAAVNDSTRHSACSPRGWPRQILRDRILSR